MDRGECEVVGSRSPTWREMVVGSGKEHDGGTTTVVECLRGRLLAERDASKTAREEADLLMERLTELERLLAEEMKSRDRAVRRLRLALKKLGSVKLVDDLGSSSSSELLTGNHRSPSSACSTDRKKPGTTGIQEKGKGDVGVLAYAYVGSPMESSSSCPTASASSWSSVESAQSVSNEPEMDPCRQSDSIMRETCGERRPPEEHPRNSCACIAVPEDVEVGGERKINGEVERTAELTEGDGVNWETRTVREGCGYDTALQLTNL